MDDQVRQLKEYMDNSNYTVAVTGAGISYMYGMGRLKQQTNRMDLMRKLTPQYVKKHPDKFYEMMKDAFLDATFEMGPGPVHKQLVELEKRGLLQGIVTQNMDCLHSVAGSTNVIEFQGSFADNVCVDCGEHYNDYTVWNQGEAPRCPKCGGPLMPANFYRDSPTHDSDYQERMNRAADMLAQADLIIVIGTTGFMSEYYMSKVRPDTIIVQINPGSTVFDQMATLNIRRDAQQVFDEILNEE